MGSRRSLALALVGGLLFRPHCAQASQDTPPPPMVLRVSGGGEQEGIIGTYCWGTQCVDMLSTSFPRCPLVFREGEALTLDFSSLGHSRRLAYTVWSYTEARPGELSRSGEIEEPAVRRGAILYPISPTSLPLDLPPGLYVVEIFTRIRRFGDTQQGFKLLVQPTSVAATPEARMTATPSTGSACEVTGG